MRIIITWLILCIVWLFAIYSVSIHESFTTTLKMIGRGGITEATNYFYFNRQVFYFFLWCVCSWIVYKLPLKRLQSERVVMAIGISVIILQLLVFTPLGMDTQATKGALWWLDLRKIGLGTTLQPVEFFKLGYVIFLSGRLLRKRSFINTREFFISFAAVNGGLFLILLFIPDMGSIMVLGLVALTMCRYAGARLRYILGMTGLGLILGLLVGLQFGYVRTRINNFIYPTDNDRNAWRQNQQALIAIWWWWFAGQWYGKGLQKFWYLPEAQSDFIFAAFSEEIGFVGNMFILALYSFLAYIVLKDLHRIKDTYMKILAVWLLSLIVIQAFVNIGVNIKILPNTGLTLPFISAGGTSLMVNMVQIMLLYKIITEGLWLKTSIHPSALKIKKVIL